MSRYVLPHEDGLKCGTADSSQLTRPDLSAARLIVGVKSNAKNRAQRRGIRETWMKYRVILDSYPGTSTCRKYLFSIGHKFSLVKGLLSFCKMVTLFGYTDKTKSELSDITDGSVRT